MILFVRPETRVYKTVDGLALKADIYRSFDTIREPPAILWLHGGWLIDGSRHWIPPSQINMYIRHGYTVVTIDYRLAPETKLPEVMADVRDAFNWLWREGHSEFHIDTDRIVVVGHDAGGFLALLLGTEQAPAPQKTSPAKGPLPYQKMVRFATPSVRPAALVSVGGFGDPACLELNAPAPRYQNVPRVPLDVIRKLVGGKPLCESRGERVKFYVHCRQLGSWANAMISDYPPTSDAALLPFSPERGIHPEFPPTFLIHGEKDREISPDRSRSMAAALSRFGVSNRLEIAAGGDENFDEDADIPETTRVFDAMFGFLDQVMNRNVPSGYF